MEGPQETNEGSEDLILAPCNPADAGILTIKVSES